MAKSKCQSIHSCPWDSDDVSASIAFPTASDSEAALRGDHLLRLPLHFLYVLGFPTQCPVASHPPLWTYFHKGSSQGLKARKCANLVASLRPTSYTLGQLTIVSSEHLPVKSLKETEGIVTVTLSACLSYLLFV